MILLVHLLFGAAIGSTIKNIPLAIVLAFLSHYLLDFIPHIDYSIENIEKNRWKKSLPDFAKVFLDFLCGIILIFVFSKSALPAGRQAIVYICAFCAILPDGFTILNSLMPNKILKIHSEFHPERVHVFKNKKISKFWRILSQAMIVIISILLLKN